jgi:homoserine kinase
MKNKFITVSAPATVANVACGFDAIGFAVNNPCDIVSVGLTNFPGIHIHPIGGAYGSLLSTKAEINTAGVAIQSFLNKTKYKGGVEVNLTKNLPLGSGMGSSAASAAAAVYAINLLFDNLFTAEDLIPFAMEAERIACGTAHADNVAPALLGGFVLIRGYNPLDVVQIPFPENLYCTIVHPHIELRTEDSRKVLPKEISLKNGVTQWSNFAGLISGLTTKNYELIGRSLQDVIVEPVRATLIPGFNEVKQSAINSGVLGCSISGSGPSVFALSTDESIANRAAIAMQQAFANYRLKTDAYLSPININKPQIISNN